MERWQLGLPTGGSASALKPRVLQVNVPDSSSFLPWACVCVYVAGGTQALRGGGREVELEQSRTSQREPCARFSHRSIDSLSLEGKSILQARLEGLGSFAGKPCNLDSSLPLSLSLPPSLQPGVWNLVRM